MAEAIVGPLVAKLQDLALNEAKALVAVNGDIRSLRDRLMWMQAFLRHADQRRRNTYDELIRVWLKQTRDAAFDAEDAIDLFVLKVDLSRDPTRTQSIIRFFAGFTTQVSIRHNLSIKIAEINSRLEDIIKNKEKYMIEFGLKDSAMVLWRPSAIMSTVTTKMDDVQAPVVKRKLEGARLLASGILNTGSTELALIYVTGKRGVGKATLVREVYERPKTQTLFEERVWASFPPYLSLSNIQQLIYQQLDDKNTWCCVEDAEMNIQIKLKERKFLLVIDGEISNPDWIALLSVLPNNGKGCRVVRIMQGSQKKPPEVPESGWISLTPFTEKETTKLFQQWVPKESNREEGNPGDKTGAKMNGQERNPGGKTSVQTNGEEGNQGDKTSAQTNGAEGNEEGKPVKEISEKTMYAHLHNMTGGLPLSVVLLCGLLRTKEYPNEWIVVLEHLKSKQSNQSKRLDIILTMCFDDLPHDVKSCFLYFAVLPMNTPIDAHKLVCMWMAEGFLIPKDGKTKEKLGRIYLKDLVARNLVKVVKKDSFSGGQFVAVHHKVHAFLQLEAQEANFVDIHNGDDTPSLTTARRLSLQNYTDKYAALAHPLPKLRSILSTFQEEKRQGSENKENVEKGEDNEGYITSTAEGVQNRKNKNAEDGVAPDGILDSGMLHCWGQGAILQKGRTNRHKYIRRMFQESRFLRVINLQGVEIGKELPATIRTVPHLQYLGVTACSLESIPSAIGKLKDLQTLDVRDTMVHELPTSFWKIKTLRHVFGSGLILPKKVGTLKHLQTLETIQPDENYIWDEKTFEGMVHLQSLYLCDSSGKRENVNALCRVIENPKLLAYLEKLVINVSNNIPYVVFTSPSQRRLRAMALCGELDEPKGRFCVPNLTFLSLKRTKVSQDFIGTVGKLPLLTNLILDEVSYEDRKLIFDDGEFKSLKKLTLSHLENLMTLVIRDTALPELTDLVITSYNENINIEVNIDREFVQKIKGEDKILDACFPPKPVTQKQSDQFLSSSST